jgi:hypothetical protein
MSWAAGKKTPKPERINQTTWGFLGILEALKKRKKNQDKQLS